MSTETMGKRIQRLRKERGLTQKQLADAVGVTPQAVSKWETDESCPDVTALPLIAGALGVSTDTLLGASSAATVVLENGTEKKSGKANWAWEWKAGKTVGLIFGVFVILAGVLLLFTIFKSEWFTNISFWDILWPSAIIFVGLSGCFSHEFSGFSLGVIAVGVIFLLNNFGVIQGDVWLILLAAVLVIVGVSIVVRQFVKRRKKLGGATVVENGAKGEKLKSDYSDADGVISYNASFGDDCIICRAEKINGGKVNVSFGDFTLDLRDVREFGDGAELEVNASFAEAVVKLPQCVRAELSTNGAFSGKGVEGSPAPDAPYVLRIKAAVSFGNLEIVY